MFHVFQVLPSGLSWISLSPTAQNFLKSQSLYRYRGQTSEILQVPGETRNFSKFQRLSRQPELIWGENMEIFWIPRLVCREKGRYDDLHRAKALLIPKTNYFFIFSTYSLYSLHISPYFSHIPTYFFIFSSFFIFPHIFHIFPLQVPSTGIGGERGALADLQ